MVNPAVMFFYFTCICIYTHMQIYVNITHLAKKQQAFWYLILCLKIVVQPTSSTFQQ